MEHLPKLRVFTDNTNGARGMRVVFRRTRLSFTNDLTVSDRVTEVNVSLSSSRENLGINRKCRTAGEGHGGTEEPR